MRDFINAILAFIGTSSLIDEEFEQMEEEISSFGYNMETFAAIKMLLVERDETTETTERLQFYFMAKGLDFDIDPAQPPKSNILIGSAL